MKCSWNVWVVLKINIWIHHLFINWPDTSTMLFSCNLCHFTAYCILVGSISLYTKNTPWAIPFNGIGDFIDNKVRKHFILIYQLNISNVSNSLGIRTNLLHLLRFVFLYFIYRWLPSKWMSEMTKFKAVNTRESIKQQ